MSFNIKIERGITLVALVITVILLVILAGISILGITQNGLFEKSKIAKERTEYTTAKEIVKMKLMEVQTESELKNKEYTIQEVAKNILEDDKITIKKCYYENRVSIKPEIDESLEELKGIVVLVNEYSKYKFLIGESCEIERVTKEDINYTTSFEEDISHIFETIEKFEKVLLDNINNTKNETQEATINELYDKYNDPTDMTKMHIGDYVNYTAGIWNETKALPESFTFGGYEEGQSRDTNSQPGYTEINEEIKYGEGKYEGWRIWDISEDKTTMTLISAGCPEQYNHSLSESNSGYNSIQILKERKLDEYINLEQYANKARILDKSDLDIWYNKYINSTVNNTFSTVQLFPSISNEKLISMITNNMFYYVIGTYRGDDLFYVHPYWRYTNCNGNYIFGIRILIDLNSNIKFEKNPQKIEQNGFTYNKWNIK